MCCQKTRAVHVRENETLLCALCTLESFLNLSAPLQIYAVGQL